MGSVNARWMQASKGLRYVQVPVRDESDVLTDYRGTPIEALLLGQNLNRPPQTASAGQLLIGLGLDHPLSLPETFGLQVRATPDTLADWMGVALSIREVTWTAIVLDARVPDAEAAAWHQMERLWSRFPATHMAPLLLDPQCGRLVQVGRYHERDPLTWSATSTPPPTPAAMPGHGMWAG